MTFSATDAAFEGFRVIRQKPLALAAWALLYLVLTIAALFASAGSLGSLTAVTEATEALEASPPTSLEGFMPLLNAYGDMMSAMAWTLPIQIVVAAVLTAAIARAVLTPKVGGFGYLRFGRDELRVFVVTLVLGLLSGLIAFAAFTMVLVVGGIAISVLQGWGALVMILGMFAAVALIVWLSVRWSLAVPITVAEKRIALFDSFALTRGRFWPLLGMAILAGIMALVVYLLSMIIVLPLSVASGLSMFTTPDDPDAMLAMFDVRNPWVILMAAVNAVIYALIAGVLYAPFSAAYRDLKGLSVEE